MNLNRVAVAASLFAAMTVSAFAQTVFPGAKAPAIEVKRWVKGTPVPALEANKTYVVEFWATWCGPCRESIPHITQLAKANPDVTFVGVGIWEEDKGTAINDFVAQMGDKMDYHIAYSGNRDGMATSWMAAAMQRGIPAAFIVKDGVVQWVGHPMSMEEPLKAVKAGTFDLNASKAEFDKTAEQNRKDMAAAKLLVEAKELYKSGDKAGANAKLDEAAKTSEQYAVDVASTRFMWLAKDDPAAWEKQAREYAASEDDDKIATISTFGLQILNEKTADQDLARKATEIALEGTKGKSFLALYYGAQTYSRLKDYKKALDVTDKAIALLPTTQYKDNEGLKTSLAKQRESFAALAAKQN